MPSINAFVDPLKANAQHTGLWTGNFGTLSWTGGGFTITNPISYTGYGGNDSIASYDLTGGAIYCSMTSIGNQALVTLETVPVKLLITGGTQSLFWYINQNSLKANYLTGGVTTTVQTTTYNSALHKYFKIRESAGTIFWDYSTNGLDWVNFASVATPITITALFIEPSLGTFSTEASATTGVWTSWNIVNSNSDTLYNHVQVADGMSRSEVAN